MKQAKSVGKEGNKLFGCVSLIGRALQEGNCRQSSSGPNDDDLIDILTLFELIFPAAFIWRHQVAAIFTTWIKRQTMRWTGDRSATATGHLLNWFFINAVAETWKNNRHHPSSGGRAQRRACEVRSRAHHRFPPEAEFHANVKLDAELCLVNISLISG